MKLRVVFSNSSDVFKWDIERFEKRKNNDAGRWFLIGSFVYKEDAELYIKSVQS